MYLKFIHPRSHRRIILQNPPHFRLILNLKHRHPKRARRRHHWSINQDLPVHKPLVRISHMLLHQQFFLHRHIHRKRSPRPVQSHKKMLFAHSPGIISRPKSAMRSEQWDERESEISIQYELGERSTTEPCQRYEIARNPGSVRLRMVDRKLRWTATPVCRNSGLPQFRFTSPQLNTGNPSAPFSLNAQPPTVRRTARLRDTSPSGHPWSKSFRRSK